MDEQRLSGPLLLDWQRVYDWAVDKEPGSKAGTACSQYLCPIAYYLGDMTGMCWSVSQTAIRPVNGWRPYWLIKPDWVDRLIRAVDETRDGYKLPITREQFRAALEEVKPS